MEPQVGLVRPFDFESKKYHADKWKEKSITILICQRKTLDIIQLSLESLLRFYPDIPILIVDGNSQDDSLLYLRYMAIKHPNITLWERPSADTNNQTSHGVTMDEAISGHIQTKYVMLMDSDVIIERGGIIEDMLEQIKSKSAYAIGSLMLVSLSNHACGGPKDESDVLRYAHPSFSLYDRDVYMDIAQTKTEYKKGLFASNRFCDHGSPCVYNMIEAQKRNLGIEYYPVDKYVSHLSGGSWTLPRTIWSNDHDVFIRPFVTFIISNGNHVTQLASQGDHDFDFLTVAKAEEKFIVIHGAKPTKFTNNLYHIRHRVTGEYICFIPHHLESMASHFMNLVKKNAIEKGMPDEMEIGGLKCIKRTVWQKRESLQ